MNASPVADFLKWNNLIKTVRRAMVRKPASKGWAAKVKPRKLTEPAFRTEAWLWIMTSSSRSPSDQPRWRCKTACGDDLIIMVDDVEVFVLRADRKLRRGLVIPIAAELPEARPLHSWRSKCLD